MEDLKGEERKQEIKNLNEKNNDGKLLLFGKGNRHTSLGSAEHPPKNKPKKACHTKTHHNEKAKG